MLKKIRFNNSIGVDLENRMESGDFRPTKLEPNLIVELEQKARRILAGKKKLTVVKKKKK